MKTPEEYFDSLLSTDANCPVDVYAHKYNRADLFRFAEAYHRDKLRDELIKFSQQFYADEETCIHNIELYLRTKP